MKKNRQMRQVVRQGLCLLWPWCWLERLTRPVPPGLWIVNGIMQRVLRINGAVPWMVHFTSWAGGDIRIGEGVWKSFALSGGCYIQGGNGIQIGDGTLFAAGVKIISANHDPRQLHKWIEAPPIRIGKRCWIGANAVILPGVELGDDVIVGAGAVVTRSVPSGTTVAGNPARPLERPPAAGAAP
jgi:carbonic anhydrase/acetyltransferase-like protein (isoleucine patch superfamily)